MGEQNVYTGATLELYLMIAIGEGSGVKKAPLTPHCGGGGGGGGGAILGGRQIVVWMWDNFENLTKVLAKLRILL